MRKCFIFLYSILLVLLIFTGCKKFEKAGEMNTPGIALTFDDDYIDNWYSYLPLLDSAGVKATFYICKYNRLTAEQKYKLSIIQSHGHEIAFHTTNHYNMEDYIYRYRHTMDELIKYEVIDGLKLMNKDGFYPVTFAYPYGAHNPVLDKMLMQYFKSVRALNGSNDFAKSLVATNANDVLYGLGIDKSSKRRDEDILRLLQSACENRTCAVLVAHNIESATKLSVTKDRLLKIFDFANKLGLRYYTISEISD